MFTRILEGDPRSGREVLHGPGHEHLGRPGVRHHPRADRDGKATALPVDDLAFAGVEACADLDAERADRVDDVLGAPDPSRRTIEPDVEAVAGRVLLLTAVLRQEIANDRVMPFEEILPSSVAELRLPLRRIDDVGE